MPPGASPRLRKAWIACGYAFVVLVIYLSLTPSPIVAPDVGGFKSGHIVAYAWLTLWFAQVYPRVRTRLAFAFAFALMGVALEYLQGMTSYRTFAYSDMVDNAYGVIAGGILAVTPLGGLFNRLNRA